MKSFTCRAVETKLHRYIVDIRLGPVMFLLNPDDASTEAEATALADFINCHVSFMSWTKMLEGFESPVPEAPEQP